MPHCLWRRLASGKCGTNSASLRRTPSRASCRLSAWKLVLCMAAVARVPSLLWRRHTTSPSLSAAAVQALLSRTAGVGITGLCECERGPGVWNGALRRQD